MTCRLQNFRLAQCACGKPFERRIEHEQLCSIVLLNPTCDDAECLAHKLLSSERIVAATEKGRRFGKMRANAEFAIVSELTTPASGRLGELLKHFGVVDQCTATFCCRELSVGDLC